MRRVNYHALLNVNTASHYIQRYTCTSA